MDEMKQWFLRGLQARIEALEAALRGVAARETEAAATVRRLAQALRAPASTYGLTSIEEAAARTEESSAQALEANTRTLIAALRSETTQVEPLSQTILIVGGEAEFNRHLSALLRSVTRDVVLAGTAEEARTVLQQKEVLFVILNLVLPDLDGRTMLLRLREDPRTASIPVLTLASKISDFFREESLVLDADGCLEGPLDPVRTAEWITARLRRAHETVKESRRDLLTGLLNRAAFREEFVRCQDRCRVSKEPLALAVLAVHDANAEAEKKPRDYEADLRNLGSLLSRSLRSTDIIGRWAPMEFALLLPGADEFGGVRAVEKILQSWHAEASRRKEATPSSLCLSGGVTVVNPAQPIDEAIAQADHYLFQARSEGGNRVVSLQSELPRRTRRVLVVEHDEVTARVLLHLFEKDGFETAAATTASEARDIAEGPQRFHLAVIDEAIPGGGLEVLQELRSQTRYSRVPVVILMSGGSEENAAQALERGASDYIIKPFAPHIFMSHVRRLLSRGTAAKPPKPRIRRILILDDDGKALLLAASSLYGRGGFKVYLSRSAQDGVQRCRDLRPDILLVNFKMPGMSDGGLLNALREGCDPEETAVLVAVEQDDQREAQKAVSQGVKGFILKPFKPLTLGKEVEERLGLTPNPDHPADGLEQLNAEIQRLVQSGALRSGA
jgi:diguanylate cyclase (GGDEF)-like protein